MLFFTFKCIIFIIFISVLLSTKNKKKRKIKIIIIACPKDGVTLNLNISLLHFKIDVIKCNNASNPYDAREAGLMLDYIIKTYNNIEYDKLLFLHDHDKASHYPTSIIDRVNELCKYNYIFQVDYIGVNCFYYNANYWNRNLKITNTIQLVDKYLSQNNIEHVKLSVIRQNKYIMPCCASFFLKTKLIYIHKKEYYISLRNSLKNFSLYGFKKYISKDLLEMKFRNYLAACYMEYSWSSIFGQKNVPLPHDCKINK